MRDISILDGQYFKESDQDTAIIIRLLDDSFQTTPTLVKKSRKPRDFSHGI